MVGKKEREYSEIILEYQPRLPIFVRDDNRLRWTVEISVSYSTTTMKSESYSQS